MLRFRENRIALVGDIEKAFLNVEVDEADRDCLRFLWVSNIDVENAETLVYRFCRVVFGLNVSPFLLNATLRHVLKFTEIDPKFVQKVLESFYADDFVGGESDTEKAFDLFDKTKGRMAEGGFNLRKWVTNSKELKEKIDLHEKVQGNGDNVVNDHESHAKLSLGSTEHDLKTSKVLGQSWDNETHETKFNLSNTRDRVKTLAPTKTNL